jgi:hypothetical protein
MNSRYEVRAESAGRGPDPYTLAAVFRVENLGTNTEVRAVASMTRGTVQDWGFDWHEAETDPKAVNLLCQIGLERIYTSLEQGTMIPKTIRVNTDFFGHTRPRIRKRCAYRETRNGGLFCTAAADNDPWSGVTTESLCLGCQMPHESIVCSELTRIETCWFPEGSEHGMRRVVKAECTGGGNPRDTSGCVPGVMSCWVRRIVIG